MIYFLSNIYRRTLLDAALWRKQTMIKEMEKIKNVGIGQKVDMDTEQTESAEEPV